LFWRRAAAGPFEVHVVPGEHEKALREPHVRVTAEKLKACIMGAQASGL
jgi:thioesterase domain-containing protein